MRRGGADGAPVASKASGFREQLDNLLTMAAQLQRLRASLARELGVTEPQYRLIWAVAELEGETGVSISAVARRLRVTGPFVTTEAAKLLQAGFLSKSANPADGRGVLLRLEPAGARALAQVAARARRINDAYFRGISPAEFAQLGAIIARLIANGEETLLMADAQPSSPPPADPDLDRRKECSHGQPDRLG